MLKKLLSLLWHMYDGRKTRSFRVMPEQEMVYQEYAELLRALELGRPMLTQFSNFTFVFRVSFSTKLLYKTWLPSFQQENDSGFCWHSLRNVPCKPIQYAACRSRK